MSYQSAPQRERQPYPGLRFYRPDQEELFAGREEEAEACAQLILGSTVTILHGVTGCGKSSFLRAGVKPQIESSDLGVRFETDSREAGRFQVIRSTALPLSEFVTKLFEVVDSLSRGGRSSFGRLRSTIDPKAFQALFSDPEARAQAMVNAEIALSALANLTNAMEEAPIFVIDQAEEVFTLTEALGPDDLPVSERDRNRQRKQYFTFLRRVASEGENVRLVISLRTEYKGRFDDEIARGGHPGSRLVGYYLDELSEKGLIAAIRRPTDPELGFGFRLEDGVAETLAAELLEPGQVPAGGVLPTLQVACLRLWKQASRVDSQPSGAGVLVRQAQLRRLGAIQLQIEEYLNESLEDACSRVEDWREDLSQVIDLWHRILEQSLVTKLADGRAVTKSQTEKYLIDKGQEILGGARRATKDEIAGVLEYLAQDDVGILTTEDSPTSTRWSLGHDSLALALDKWRTAFGASAASIMRMTTAGRASETLESKHLFWEGEEVERPTRILIPLDSNWDRQIAIFARPFAERLGFEFVEDPHLSALTPISRNGPKDWTDLRNRIAIRQQDTEAARVPGGKDERVLVAADWSEFPGEQEDDGNFDRRTHAPQWSDLLVTDMYLGSALIGPELDVKETLEAREIAEDAIVAIRRQLRDVLGQLHQRRAIFRCADNSGVEFLHAAARLTDSPDFDRYLNEIDVVSTLKGSAYEDSDPLTTWLSDEGAEDSARPRFIVAGPFARALAVQAGYIAHFGTKHITRLARDEMEIRKRSKQRAKLSRGIDLAADVQKLVSHTLWQISIPAAQWRQGLNRAFVLRLASVGYYSIEHVKTHMDRFVMHVHAWANSTLTDADSRGDGMKGSRLYRGIIRETISESFDFLRFDEYPEHRYDLDSPHAYWSDHAALQSKSVAGEIYNELASLRLMTISHFDVVAQGIGWLRSRVTADGSTAYNPSDPVIVQAAKLKEFAWNNYRILNFYDSERYMARAAEILSKKMETVGYL